MGTYKVFLCFCVMIFLSASPAFAGAGAKSLVSPVEAEYLELAPLLLPVVGSNGVTQQVSIAVSLELSPGQTEQIVFYKPRLTDAYIQDLYGALGIGHGLNGHGVLDVQMLKARLLAVTERIVGPGRVQDVLLQVIHQRHL